MLLLAATCTLLLSIPEITFGAPIAESTWDVATELAQQPTDAVIIADHTLFLPNEIQRYRLVRVLNQNGKAAAEISETARSFGALQGRVVDRKTLRETQLQADRDLEVVPAFRFRRASRQNRILLPPGLTNDCVVELRWTLPALDGLPEGELNVRYDVGEDWPVRLKTYLIAGSIRSAPNGMTALPYLSRRFNPKSKPSAGSGMVTSFSWGRAKDAGAFNLEQTPAGQRLVFQQVVPLGEYPYGDRFRDFRAPYVQGFKTLPLSDNPQVFYNDFAARYLAPRYTLAPVTRPYKRWLKSLKLPESPDAAAAATLVYNQLRERIAATDLMPADRKAAMKRNPGKYRRDNHRLEESFRLGYSTPQDLGLLFYYSLRDLKIPFNLIYPNPNDEQPFDPKARNPWVLLLQFPIFEVAGAEGPVYYAPQWQECPPGYLPLPFQGQRGLRVEPDNNWRWSIAELPRPKAEVHRHELRYEGSLSADGRLALSITEHFGGEYLVQTRRRYFPFSRQEADADARNQWARRLRGWSVAGGRVTGANNHSTPIVRSAQAAVTLSEIHDGRLLLRPFPGSNMPLGEPSVWPPNRSQPIRLPHRFAWTQTTKLTIPEGAKLLGLPSWERSNALGGVRFKADQKGAEITVRLDITVKQNWAPWSSEPHLKRLIAWMDEAHNQRIALQLTEPQP